MEEQDKKRFEFEMANYVPPSMMSAAQAAAHAAQHSHANPFGLAAEDLNAGKRGRRRKKKIKDPNAPKRCMSAFFWFSQDERAKVRAANPDFAVGDVAKELGRRWGEVGETLKSKYEVLAEQDRARYDRDKRAYKQKLKDEANGVNVPGGAAVVPVAAAAVVEAPRAVLPVASPAALLDSDEDELEEEELLLDDEEEESE